MPTPPNGQDTGRSRINSALLWLILGVTFFLVTVKLFHAYQPTFHSDAALKTVLARLSAAEGRLIPHNWVYANGDLFLVSPQTFSIIIFPWLGISYFANALASWLAYVFLTLSVYGTCRQLAPDRPQAAIVAAALTAGGISAANFEFVIGQGAYSMYAALTLCLFGLASRQIAANNLFGKLTTLTLTAIAAGLLCASNATRGDMTIVIPLLSGWFAAMLVMPAPNLRERIRRLYNPSIYAIIFGAFIGSLLYKYWLLPSVFNYEAAARIAIASRSEMWHHFLQLPSAWFEYFQVTGSWQASSPISRVLQCAVWLIALALIAAPLWVIFTPKNHDLPLVSMAWIVISCYGVSAAALIVSSTLFTGPSEIRYATFPIYGSVCIIAILADKLTTRHSIAGPALLFTLGLSGVLTASQSYLQRNPSAQFDAVNYAQRMSLIRSLEANRVGTVLTTYWNSHVLTVLSNGNVDGYPVGVNPLYPFAHHMPRYIFYGRAGTRQAVAFTDSEADLQVWTAIEYQLGTPAQKLVDGPFNIWIYDRDIAQAVLETGREIDTAIPKDQLKVRLSEAHFDACISHVPCQAWITVTNTGKHALVSVGSLPLRLGIHGVDSNGGIVVQDEGRADFPGAIESGSTARVRLVLPPMSDPKATSYQVCLLQEGVAWLCDHTYTQ